MKFKIATVIGARPQFIKASVLSRVILTQYTNKIEEYIIHTGQHYDSNMSEVFFTELNLPKPMVNLNCGGGSHAQQKAMIMNTLEPVLVDLKPDALLVYGDTNSTLAAALVASKLEIPIAHIEAGLRSFNKKMPEEINRVLTDHLSTFLFYPTLHAFNNLVHEGFKINNESKASMDAPHLINSGDVMYDNTLYYSKQIHENPTILKELNLISGKYLLITIHRPINTDDDKRLENILSAALDICKKHRLHIVFPIHPRTREKLNSIENVKLRDSINNNELIKLIEPCSYLDILTFIKHSKMIITDSGGLQKEGYFLNKDILICREETEWLELIEQGRAILVDANPERMMQGFETLSNNEKKNNTSLFGNGKAAEIICETLYKHFTIGEP